MNRIYPKAAFAAALLPCLMAAPAVAAGKSDTSELEAMKAQLSALQQKITDLEAKQKAADADARTEITEVYNQVQEASEAHEAAQKDAVKVSVKNGSPSFKSADGNFSAAIHATLQTDFAYYMQGSKAKSLGSDLSSGANIRRAQLGLSGTLFHDWSYKFNYEFGGSHTESGATILDGYLQYDGVKNLALRAGVFAPSYNIEDQTGATQLMFMERNTPTNILRKIAGAEGRIGLSAMYSNDRFLGAVSLTMRKVGESGIYDEQQALVARLAYLAVDDKADDVHLLVDGNFVNVFSLPDTYASGTTTLPRHSITLSDAPELTVDDTSTKLISTGALAADNMHFWGLEAAGNYKNFYLQGSYNGITINRADTYTVYTASGTSETQSLHGGSNTLSAWYLQASWILTGESKSYNAGKASFGAPKPAQPFSLEKGTWGAVELAGRYSDTDLNDNLSDSSSIASAWSGDSKTYTFYKSVRGGEQKIWTLGLNWYLNSAVRISADYMWIDIDRISATSSTGALPTKDIGQKLQALSFRTQFTF